MRLTVIGCSGSIPGPESPASCYLLEAPHEEGDFRLVLDLGSGAFGALQRWVDPRTVDAVALSHLHADHCLDLTALYVHHRYHPRGPHPAVGVFGPPGTGARLARAYDGSEAELARQLEVHTWGAPGTDRIGPFDVAVAQVAHPVPTYAIRLTSGGRTFVYSGDTGPCDALVDLATGADALLCEASFVETGDNPPDLHLTGRQAAEHATKAGVGRLLLTHIPPWYAPDTVLAEARAAYEGPLELAEPGASYEI